MPEVQTPAAPVEAPDPFKGGSPTLEEFSIYRKDGTVPERFQDEPKAEEPPAAPAKEAKTVEDQGTSETEQEKEERERDEQGKFKKRIKFDSDQQAEVDRIVKKRLAEDRASRRNREPEPAAQTSVAHQGTPPVKEAVAAAPQNELVPPKIPNLNTWAGTAEEYEKAVDEYPVKLEAYLDAKRQFQEQGQALSKRLIESEAAAAKAHPDYKEKFDELVEDIRAGAASPLPPHVLRAIAEESENAHEITYHLAANRDEYTRFASLSPQQAIREVLRLDVKLSTKPEAAPAHVEAPAKPTKPKPPEPVGARASSSAFDVNDEKTDANEWHKRRNEQVAKQGRR